MENRLQTIINTKKQCHVYSALDVFTGRLVAQINKQQDNTIVVITADETSARQTASDIACFTSQQSVLHIETLHISPYTSVLPSPLTMQPRMKALFSLYHHQSPAILVLSVASLIKKTLPKQAFDQLSKRLIINQEVSLDDLSTQLVSGGYTKSTMVTDPGMFAIRGNIIDVFPSFYQHPIRIELFADYVETIRSFDIHTQRTIELLDEIIMHPVTEAVCTDYEGIRKRILHAADIVSQSSKKTNHLLSRITNEPVTYGLIPSLHQTLDPIAHYFPENYSLILHNSAAILRSYHSLFETAHREYQQQIHTHDLAFAPEDHYITEQQWDRLLQQAQQEIHIHHEHSSEDCVVIQTDDLVLLRNEISKNRHRPMQQESSSWIKPLIQQLKNWHDYKMLIVINDKNLSKKIVGLLNTESIDVVQHQSSDDFETLLDNDHVLVHGTLSQGGVIHDERLILLTEKDFFGTTIPKTRAQKVQSIQETFLKPLSDFSILKSGDYLVHKIHGIGVYQGIAEHPSKEYQQELLQVDYADGILYIPLYQLSCVERYVGTTNIPIPLDKLGGATWAAKQTRVRQEVQHLAEILLQIYAKRHSAEGHRFTTHNDMFTQFEANFPFEETYDQKQAIEDVINDMESSKPTDRMICGDVGYGKTEVALRATMKAVINDKQVAVLAPTTVLVEQHFVTFAQRFSSFPISVAKLSRFQTKKEQLKIIEDLLHGRINIIIGTHRLLSNDIRFHDLGLIVVDEEQRFGVIQKEKLRKARTQTDTISLTASPIPRSLHMSMLGLRDISLITTPPHHRKSIQTFLTTINDTLIKNAIIKEINRQGQVFIVCPRIEGGTNKKNNPSNTDTPIRSVNQWVEHISTLVPTARVTLTHSQLSTDQLEKNLMDFIAHKKDVLVTTSIIENGIDIPNANTMFIDRAELFGLSQLYQLRGRIGRSINQAFCYLLIPQETMTPKSHERLNLLQRFSNLGSGFQIASHDLELRGAGDLLGKKQSGLMSSVGFETYTTLLHEEIERLRGTPVSSSYDIELNIHLPSYLPAEYIPDIGQRLDLYKRLSNTQTKEELLLISEEMNDRYGEFSEPIVNLIDIMLLKIYAKHLNIISLDLTIKRMIVSFQANSHLTNNTIMALIKKNNYQLRSDGRLQCVFPQQEQHTPASLAQQCLLSLSSEH